jgi:hypothetical protein
MKSTKPILVTALVLLAGLAQAQAIRITVPDDVPPPVSNTTRAEVIADFHMWRLAGLHALHRGEASPDTTSLEYQKAEAKYAWLRASPQFATLVAELSQRPLATVVAQRARADAVELSVSK